MAFSIQCYIYAMTNVTHTASEELISTVAVLPDQVLLEQTRMLARHEQALQLSVLDHLREIEARRLYLRLGYSSLFDYTVRELHYTEASAWRRIKAMRLCRETRGVREWLQDGSLNLSNAALLQNSFERWDRGGAGPVAVGSPGVGTNAAPRAGSTPEAAPGKAPTGVPLPVLDARARQQLVERAMGKSTRQVQQMLAEVDPEAAAPAERLRALGDGRWELKAVIDDECQRGLQKLRELLSHVDPHLSVGQLVGRLVQEGCGALRSEPAAAPEAESVRSFGRKAFPGDAGAGDDRSRCRCGGEPGPGPEVRRADGVPFRTEAVREADSRWRFAGRLASRRRLRWSFAQETARAVAGQPYFGAEASCAACQARQERRRCDGGRADFVAEVPRGSRQFDFGSQLRRRRIRGPDFGGEASRGNRRRGIDGANFGGEVRQIGRQIDSVCGQARGLAARSGLLQLRRPAHRTALRLTLLPGVGPHPAGRARRRCGAGEPPPSLRGSPPLPARSPAALRAARLGDVSKAQRRRSPQHATQLLVAERAGAECRPRS